MSEPLTPATAWVCDWCGVWLRPDHGVWTDADRRGSGDYCPEGRALDRSGTSPHLPVRKALDAERAAREANPDDAECPTCDGSFRHEWPCPALLRCAVEGCDREATCGFPSPGGYLRVCGAHFDPEARA